MDRGNYSARGPAASGSFGGRQPSYGYGGGGYGGGGYGGNAGGIQQVDRNAVAQRQNERLGRLGPPDGGQGQRQENPGERRDQFQQNAQERQDARDARREERQQNDANRREDWQDYAEDHDDDHDHGYYYGYPGAVAAGVAVGVAIGAAATAPPNWTLPCTPTTVVVGGTTYYQCESAWYIRVYDGGDVAYTSVNPPAGY